MYSKVPLTLTHPQFLKIRRGGMIQLKPSQFNNPRHFLMLHPETVNKINKNLSKGKGVRIIVSPHEFECSGEGLKEWFQKAGTWIKDKIINTPLYQQAVKPVTRYFVEQGMAKIPEGKVKEAIREKVEKFGEESGAYGFMPMIGTPIGVNQNLTYTTYKPPSRPKKKGRGFKTAG